MAIYRFRVTFEDQDDVSRDIEIRPGQTFEDLHHAIHGAVGFDASKPASFYMSDDHWTKGREISNRELTQEEQERVAVLRNSRLCDFIADPHQKIYYLFDPSAKWAFRIELIKILLQEEPGASYPRCTKVTGDAPKQYGPLAAGPLPVPEDFDPESDLLDDEEDMEDIDTSDDAIEPVATAEEVSGMGELDTNLSEDEEGSDEFQTADDEIMDEEGNLDNDEF